jgi:hypothetical protein
VARSFSLAASTGSKKENDLANLFIFCFERGSGAKKIKSTFLNFFRQGLGGLSAPILLLPVRRDAR